MIYVFVFQGEFGFELLNWQGVIRRFATTIGPGDKIICCSRSEVYPLYESADEFLDVSEVPLFKNSRASAYWGIFSPAELPRYRLFAQFKEKSLKGWMRVQLKRYIRANSRILQAVGEQKVRFVFSAGRNRINGCVFGWTRRDGVMDIYDLLDVDNNLYAKIEPVMTVRSRVEEQLGWSLDEPYLLIQSRIRDSSTDQPSEDMIDEQQLVQRLTERVRTVLISFDTGRWLDSVSQFALKETGFHYLCNSFADQSCLVHHAKHCLFFTKGDFGSHIYVPPLLGKDVTAIAPRSIYQLESTPIDFWNEHVFTFGGHIIAQESEPLFSTAGALDRFAKDIVSRYF